MGSLWAPTSKNAGDSAMIKTAFSFKMLCCFVGDWLLNWKRPSCNALASLLPATVATMNDLK